MKKLTYEFNHFERLSIPYVLSIYCARDVINSFSLRATSWMQRSVSRETAEEV